MQNQLPEPQPKQRSSRQYFIGIGIGFVPLILALIGIGGFITRNGSNLFGVTLEIALFLYGGVFIAAIVCLSIKRVRFVGYGLLTMVIATPIISFIGCVVVIAHIPY